MKRHMETRNRAKRLRSNLSPPERRLWNAIRANRIGVKFQRQVVLPPYIADFASRSRKLVIELDGDTHADRQSYDAARTAALARMGYRVIRLTNADVIGNLEGVIRAILIKLEGDPQAPLSLPSPPQGGEG